MQRAIAWFAENHVAANLLMVMMLFGRLVALPSIQQQAFPDVDLDMVRIAVPYPAAPPAAVAPGASLRLGEAMQPLVFGPLRAPGYPARSDGGIGRGGLIHDRERAVGPSEHGHAIPRG